MYEGTTKRAVFTSVKADACYALGKLLIDDKLENVQEWRAAGGIAWLWDTSWGTVVPSVTGGSNGTV